MTCLLPPNATPFELALEAGIRAPAVDVPIWSLWNPLECPLEILPWLAWSYSVDNWSSDWDEPTRRQAVRDAVPNQSRKGTVASVEDAIAATVPGVVLVEWWQTDPPGVPATFTLSLDLEAFAPPSEARLRTVVNDVRRTKPARSHFTFTQTVSAELGLGLTVVARTALFTRLEFTE